MTTLVLAEHDGATLKPATRHVVAAAAQLGEPVDIILIGNGIDTVATTAASISGIGLVLVADDTAYAHPTAETIASVVVNLSRFYSGFLAAATTFGKNIMPRIAAISDVQQISEIVKVISPDTFVRPIYAGNALATVQSKDALKVITVRTTAFEPAPLSDQKAKITPLPVEVSKIDAKFVGEEVIVSERPELTSARVVISGGRGMQNSENFKLLEPIAEKLGAAIGASRAAVDAGFVSNDLQVGQTGKIVAPELYIAVGISGAIQHLAGMAGSKVIVAINKDPDAPIFEVADYGLVADLFVALPELHAALQLS